MNLQPQDILKLLGFDVPKEGIFINPADALLITETLRLAGTTINVDRVPDTDLEVLDHKLTGLVNTWSQTGQIAPIATRQESDAESLRKLRATMSVLLSITFKRQ